MMENLNRRVLRMSPFFGKWRVSNPPLILGSGNSSTVYEVESDGMRAALKVIEIPRYQQLSAWKRMSTDPDFVRRMTDREMGYVRTEIEVMKSLKGISQIVCFENSAIYPRTDNIYGWYVAIRMEKLYTLDAVLRDPGLCGADRFEGPQDGRLLLKIWRDLLEGLDYCEMRHVVHLDIKPDNIFYAPPSQDCFRLGDFGVSVRTQNGKTAANMVVGTVSYMAPEIRAGRGGDVRSDIYSLGMVMYELFNGRRPPLVPTSRVVTQEDFDNANKQRFDGKKIPAIRGASSQVSRILLKCLEYEPENRYQSIYELRREVAEIKLRKGLFGRWV